MPCKSYLLILYCMQRGVIESQEPEYVRLLSERTRMALDVREATYSFHSSHLLIASVRFPPKADIHAAPNKPFSYSTPFMA